MSPTSSQNYIENLRKIKMEITEYIKIDGKISNKKNSWKQIAAIKMRSTVGNYEPIKQGCNVSLYLFYIYSEIMREMEIAQEYKLRIIKNLHYSDLIIKNSTDN